MKTLEGIVSDGQIRLSEPLNASEHALVMVTVLEEGLDELRAQSQAILSSARQARLTHLLALNKGGGITAEQERELDEILAEAYELAAIKARADRLLGTFSES